jgi:hypothetical protein
MAFFFSSVLHHLKIQKLASKGEKQNPCRYFRAVFDNQNVTYQG